MQEPSYHLQAVVKSRDEREDFTGPLDLILMLLAKNKIEIRDIQISSLLDQYLAYLARMKEMDLEIASEFVQMASHLTYIKTRMLLASDPEEVSELEVLVNALEQLQHRDMLNAVKEVAPRLGERAKAGFRLHTKEAELQLGQRYEYHSSGDELFRALAAMLLRSGAPQQEEPALLRAMPQPITYGIKEKSEEIVNLLDKRRKNAPAGAVCSLQEPQRAGGGLYLCAGALLQRRDPCNECGRRVHGEPWCCPGE